MTANEKDEMKLLVVEECQKMIEEWPFDRTDYRTDSQLCSEIELLIDGISIEPN